MSVALVTIIKRAIHDGNGCNVREVLGGILLIADDAIPVRWSSVLTISVNYIERVQGTRDARHGGISKHAATLILQANCT